MTAERTTSSSIPSGTAELIATLLERPPIYEEAQRLDISGRSSMTRHELAVAVRSSR